jgi:hypothetical protein
LVNTPEFAQAQRQRKKVEALFAELKNQIGLRRLRLRRILEDQIPESHLLRLIDLHISFEFVRQRLKDSYNDTGRPSIDPSCCCAFF